MGASIFWQPVAGRPIVVGTRSEFIAALGIPGEFGAGSLQFLRGLAAGRHDWATEINAICDAIDHHGTVYIWVQKNNLVVHLNDVHRLDFLGIAEKMPVSEETP
jgi:hypothetical protein